MRAIRIVGVVTAVLLSVILVFVTAVFIVNQYDTPLSDTSKHYLQRAEVADPFPYDGNGYVFARGFDVGKNEDPNALGTKRVQWINKQLITLDASQDSPLFESDDSFQSDITPSGQQLIERCDEDTDRCARAIRTALHQDPQALISNQWIAIRYQKLLHSRLWYENPDQDLTFDLPPIGDIFDAQYFYHALIQREYDAGNLHTAQLLLNDELLFWRTVLRDTSHLINKMVSAKAIEKHFLLSNGFFQRVPSNTTPSLVPPEWHNAFSVEELSLESVLIGEFAYNVRLNLRLEAGIGEFDEIGSGQWFSQLLYDPNATANHFSELLEHTIPLFDEPLSKHDAVATSLQTHCNQSKELTFPSLLYNPMGKILIRIQDCYISDYYSRIVKLEGIRRMANVRVGLWQTDKSEAQVRQVLKQEVHLNPFTQSEFEWNADSQTLSFSLTSGDGERNEYRLTSSNELN